MKKQLNKSEIKSLLRDIKAQYDYEPGFTPKHSVELRDKRFLYVDGQCQWFYQDGLLLPHLRLLHTHNFLPRVTVDMGAVKFVTSGADVFRPGIVDIDDDITEGQIVSVVEETHKKALAVGKSLGSSAILRQQEGGTSVQTLHHVGDDVWEH